VTIRYLKEGCWCRPLHGAAEVRQERWLGEGPRGVTERGSPPGPFASPLLGYSNGQGGTAYERSGFSGYQPCDALGDYTSGATAGPSFAGISVDGLTVTSNSSEVAVVPAGSA
jgi:hypothetical protein